MVGEALLKRVEVTSDVNPLLRAVGAAPFRVAATKVVGILLSVLALLEVAAVFVLSPMVLVAMLLLFLLLRRSPLKEVLPPLLGKLT